jgi:hypothetical protein
MPLTYGSFLTIPCHSLNDHKDLPGRFHMTQRNTRWLGPHNTASKTRVGLLSSTCRAALCGDTPRVHIAEKAGSFAPE